MGVDETLHCPEGVLVRKLPNMETQVDESQWPHLVASFGAFWRLLSHFPRPRLFLARLLRPEGLVLCAFGCFF